ncbi:NUDIX domain-containing protein [Kosakonia pseudosacchari]|uniref:NUDIX hydrolase n=1 Tax=Kosakonia pseudosacchari TaxID=1646340 RepID=UPI0022F038CE|nr:NUDIX domain-containing protein [Kosakonia pseudosacchari]WBU47972.1 NUDIX domain-containing protein [Kosakonia pseudosacchari]
MKRERYNLSVAVFVLLRKAQRICMLKRTGTGWMDGCYSLPAGGLEQHETLAATAAREANEETGVVIAPEDLHLAHTLHVWTENRSWMGHFFCCTRWQGEPFIAEPEKHGDLCWHAIDDLPENTIGYVKQAIEQIAAGQSYSEYGW